jgi:hypothetical protein
MGEVRLAMNDAPPKTSDWSPSAIGALAGFLLIAAVVVLIFGFAAIDYLCFHYGEDDYFEDGAFLMLVVAPPVYVIIWGPVAAVLGAIIGGCVAFVLRSINVLHH